MAILATHNHNGTIGNTATAAAEGYDGSSGTATYVAGGVSGGVAINYPAGTVFHRDDVTAAYSLQAFTPVAVTGNTTILRITTAADAALASVRWTSTGALAAFSALSTQVDITATGVITAGTTYYLATRTSSSTQEVRLYSAAGELLDVLTGAAVAGTVGRYYVGHGHAGASTDAVDVDEVLFGDGWMAPVITATETDTAQTVGKTKSRTLGIANETDTAVALGRVKRKALGTATELDSAQPVTEAGGITAAISPATETDAAIPLGRIKTKALGTVIETDAAQSLVRAKAKALGLASETDAAQALGRIHSRLLGVATETDTPLTLGRLKARAVGSALETDAAMEVVRVIPYTPADSSVSVAPHVTSTATASPTVSSMSGVTTP
jgi:hypothetical protein